MHTARTDATARKHPLWESASNTKRVKERQRYPIAAQQRNNETARYRFTSPTARLGGVTGARSSRRSPQRLRRTCSGLPAFRALLRAMFAAKLELKRRMTDSFVLQPVFDLMLELFGIVQRPDYDMRRQSILRRTDRPDVHMVHILDTRVGLRNGAPHAFAVDSDGHAVQRQAQAVVQQLGRGEQDDQGDRDADNRIDRIPSREPDDDSRHEHAHRHERVGGHMQISPLDIQVLLLIADKQPGRERIDHDADAGHPRDTVAVDRLRIIQFADALDQNHADGHEQNAGVEQRDEHGTLPITVGIACRRLHASQPESDQRQHQADYVAQVVSGVRDQRDRVEPKSGSELDADENQIQHDTEHESPIQVVDRQMMVMIVSHRVFLLMIRSYSEAAPERERHGRSEKTLPAGKLRKLSGKKGRPQGSVRKAACQRGRSGQ